MGSLLARSIYQSTFLANVIEYVMAGVMLAGLIGGS
jgi:hypothetical protein